MARTWGLVDALSVTSRNKRAQHPEYLFSEWPGGGGSKWSRWIDLTVGIHFKAGVPEKDGS